MMIKLPQTINDFVTHTVYDLRSILACFSANSIRYTQYFGFPANFHADWRPTACSELRFYYFSHEEFVSDLRLE